MKDIVAVTKKTKRERYQVKPRDYRSLRKSQIIRTEEWRTQDRRVVQVHEMSDRHIINCVKFILREVPKKWESMGEGILSFLNNLQGNMAMWHAEQMYANWEMESWIDLVPPIVCSMVEEAEDRGLVIEMEGDEYMHITKEALDEIFGKKLKR